MLGGTILKLNLLPRRLHGVLPVINVLHSTGIKFHESLQKTLLEALKIPSRFIICHSANVNIFFVFLLKLEINMAFCLFLHFCTLVSSSQERILLVGCCRAK